MKLRILALIFLALMGAGAAQAQYTTVSGQALDKTGYPLSNGKWQAVLQLNGPAGTTYDFQGSQSFPQAFSGTLDINGNMPTGFQVPDNNTISPAGLTKYIFTFCTSGITPAGVPITPTCFSTAATTVTGGSQSITSAINTAAVLSYQPATPFPMTIRDPSGSNFFATFFPTTLTANRKYTLPDSSGTIGFAGGAMSFSAITTGSNTSATMTCGIGCKFLINYNAAAAPTAQTGTLLQVLNSDATISRIEQDSYAAASHFTGVRSDGTLASRTTLAADDEITSLNAFGYTGAAIAGPAASFRLFAAQTWTASHLGSYADIATVPNNSTTLTEVARFENDGGITVPNTVTGGSKGAGSINAGSLYIAGVAVESSANAVVNNAANTYTGASSTQTFIATSTTAASINIPAGTAPTANVAGDLFNVGGILKFNDGTNTQSEVTLSSANSYTSGHLPQLSGTNGLLSDSAIVAANVVNASAPGVGIAHFAGSTQTVTSSAVNLAGADVTGVLPIGNLAATVVNASSPGAGVAHFAGSTQTVTSSAVTSADATGNTSGSGNFCLVTNCAMTTPNLGTPSAINLTNATSPPTWNQNTTGSAASLSISGQSGLLTFAGLTSTNRAKTVRDAADTILELGGSYTPTGTWTNMTFVTPTLGAASATSVTSSAANTSFVAGVASSATGGIQFFNAGNTGSVSIKGPSTASNFTATLSAATGNISLAKVGFCGSTSTCSATAETLPIIQFGNVAMSSGTVTVTSLTAYTGTADYSCTANDQTAATLAIKVVNTSASSVTFSATGGASDVVSYVCVGF